MNRLPKSLQDKKYLDGEKLFRKYYEMGEAKSIQRLANWAISVGMATHIKSTKANQRGLPAMGVWKSMWRWATLKENRDMAWEIVHQYDTVSKEKWLELAKNNVRAAWQHPTEAKRIRFMKENDWV